MKLQETIYFCGPASMACATRALGRPVGQNNLAKLAGTTEAEGTDEQGVMRALVAKGFQVDPFGTNVMLAAKKWVTNHLSDGNPLLVCINSWSHWCTIIGTLGPDKYIMFDPARYEYRIKSGVTVLTWKRLTLRWRASRRLRGDEPAYYGIAVRDKPK